MGIVCVIPVTSENRSGTRPVLGRIGSCSIPGPVKVGRFGQMSNPALDRLLPITGCGITDVILKPFIGFHQKKRIRFSPWAVGSTSFSWRRCGR